MKTLNPKVIVVRRKKRARSKHEAIRKLQDLVKDNQCPFCRGPIPKWDGMGRQPIFCGSAACTTVYMRLAQRAYRKKLSANNALTQRGTRRVNNWHDADLRREESEE